MFSVVGIKRGATGWETSLTALSPVESINGRLYKREDKYAPLGPGGVNGSKLRQLIWLTDNARREGACGIINGASVHSPQVSMSAIVGAHYGLPVKIILGGTKPEKAIRHENVSIAAAAGATFEYIGVGYNPALQRAVRDWHGKHPDWFRLCYGITTQEEASDAEVAAFHAVGAAQAQNLPDGMKTLIMTMGSANSVTSVLYGLAQYPPKQLERVILLGIGPTRLEWLDKRLQQIERAAGFQIRSLFRRDYHSHRALAKEQDSAAQSRSAAQYTLTHYDLHATKYVTYGERRPYRLDGIDFHPTYEGKALTYMHQYDSKFRGWWHHPQEDVLFWIVGSEPKLKAMEAALR